MNGNPWTAEPGGLRSDDDTRWDADPRHPEMATFTIVGNRSTASLTETLTLCETHTAQLEAAWTPDYVGVGSVHMRVTCPADEAPPCRWCQERPYTTEDAEADAADEAYDDWRTR